MVYVDTPISTDDQDVSAPQMRGNFLQANTSFALNHYAFSDLTANNGMHKVIQTPNQVTHPVTVAAIPAIYGMQDSAPIGVIDYSRGPSNAVPTPLTSLHSTAAALPPIASAGTTNILDFTGLTIVIADFRAFNSTTGALNVSTIFFAGGIAFYFSPIQSGFLLQLQNSGNILQLKNATVSTLSDVYWTLKFIRIQ